MGLRTYSGQVNPAEQHFNVANVADEDVGIRSRSPPIMIFFAITVMLLHITLTTDPIYWYPDLPSPTLDIS